MESIEERRECTVYPRCRGFTSVDYINIDNISFQQINICITVADLGSFTDAANALYISQPTISKQISNLERTLGIILFIRSKNTAVRLTPAGKILVDKWRDFFADFNESVLQAAQTQACQPRPIVISTTPAANIDQIISPFLRFHHEQYPDEDIRISLLSVESGFEALNKGDTDILICNPFRRDLFNQEALTVEWLLRAPWSVGMRKTNPLSSRKHLNWTDLQRQKFVVPNSKAFIDQLNGYCENAGFHPKISHITRYFSGLAVNVQNDDECFLTDRYLADYGKPGFVYFDMTGNESGLIIVSRKNELDLRVARLVQEIVEFCADMEGNAGPQRYSQNTGEDDRCKHS